MEQRSCLIINFTSTDPNDLIEVNGVKIVSRMLNNLKFIAIKENDYNEAIEYCSYQILIENINFQLYIEREPLCFLIVVKKRKL